MEKNNNNSAFVFNCNYNGLGVIHGLKECKNLSIYALDIERTVGTHSKYVHYLRIPDVLKDEKGFVNFLLNLNISPSKKVILFPTNDHWVEAVSRNQNLLSQKYILCSPKYDTLEKILSKDVFASILEEIGIPIPKVYKSSISLDELEYPIAIKSVQRRRAANDDLGEIKATVSDELRFVICKNKEEAFKQLNYAKENNVPVYFQQIVHGNSSSMRTIGLFANQGIIKGLFYGKKVRGYPAQYGDCIVGEAEEIPDWAREYAKKIISHISYTGIAEIEFMIDENSGKPYFIEMNPRSWSWIEICRHLDLNLAKIAYENLVLGIDTPYKEAYVNKTKPVRFYKVLEDFVNCLKKYQKDGFSEWSMSFSQWRNELQKTNNVYAEFPTDDISICFFNILLYIKKSLKNIFLRIFKRR